MAWRSHTKSLIWYQVCNTQSGLREIPVEERSNWPNTPFRTVSGTTYYSGVELRLIFCFCTKQRSVNTKRVKPRPPPLYVSMLRLSKKDTLRSVIYQVYIYTRYIYKRACCFMLSLSCLAPCPPSCL